MRELVFQAYVICPILGAVVLWLSWLAFTWALSASAMIPHPAAILTHVFVGACVSGLVLGLAPATAFFSLMCLFETLTPLVLLPSAVLLRSTVFGLQFAVLAVVLTRLLIEAKEYSVRREIVGTAAGLALSLVILILVSLVGIIIFVFVQSIFEAVHAEGITSPSTRLGPALSAALLYGLVIAFTLERRTKNPVQSSLVAAGLAFLVAVACWLAYPVFAVSGDALRPQLDFMKTASTATIANAVLTGSVEGALLGIGFSIGKGMKGIRAGVFVGLLMHFLLRFVSPSGQLVRMPLWDALGLIVAAIVLVAFRRQLFYRASEPSAADGRR